MGIVSKLCERVNLFIPVGKTAWHPKTDFKRSTTQAPLKRLVSANSATTLTI